jgi:aminoglycoside phosphotransferase (APT) family kinase protein
LKQEFDLTAVQQICAQHQIKIKDLKSFAGSFNKKVFSINNELLLRVSETPMTQEEDNFSRVSSLNFVPKMIHTGTLDGETGTLYYLFLTLLPGDDFVNSFPETTLAQQKQLGKDVAEFLDNLQEITGTFYDIGLYVPALPSFSGTWREGHQAYWEMLKQGAEQLPLQPESTRVFEKAFHHLLVASSVLEFQSGPKLLHNDLHPKNTLLDHGKFSGVIDWECSQFGEADFELCHFIHWCVYPPEPGIDFKPFLRALFEAAPACSQVPHLAQRLTIYQIEHEIQQMIWHGGAVESWRVPRLTHWLEGGVEDLFREIGV